MIKRLPFYYSSEAVGSDLSTNTDQASNNTTNEQMQQKNTPESTKTYTQEEVNAMLAKEKRQGKNSVLNALGLKTVDEAKAALNAAKAAADANKTEEQIAAEALNAAKGAQQKAENDLLDAKRTIAVMKAGFNPRYVDDVVAIASKKVTEDKDFDAVLNEMKTTHQFYLTEAKEQPQGTGTATTGYKKQVNSDSKESYGELLAKRQSETLKRANEYNFFK